MLEVQLRSWLPCRQPGRDITARLPQYLLQDFAGPSKLHEHTISIPATGELGPISVLISMKST